MWVVTAYRSVSDRLKHIVYATEKFSSLDDAMECAQEFELTGFDCLVEFETE